MKGTIYSSNKKVLYVYNPVTLLMNVSCLMTNHNTVHAIFIVRVTENSCMSCVLNTLFIFITYSTSYCHFDKLLDLRNVCVCVCVCFQAVCMYVVGSKSFRPDIQKLRQMENVVRDI